MKTTFDSETEKRIRRTVKLGNPWALVELTMGVHGEDRKLAGGFGEIVVDEYRRRLSAMPLEEMRELAWLSEARDVAGAPRSMVAA